MFNVEVLADSLSPQRDRLTTMKITFPRIILAEFNTHRMFSRNSASSRAIPFKKMVQMVKENPFIPLVWQKHHSGMQGSEYFSSGNGDNVHKLTEGWLKGRDSAVQIAEGLHNSGVTKQLCNRLLEPFMGHTALVTATEWENFFALRCPMYVWEELPGSSHMYRSKKDALRDIQKRGYDITNFLKQSDIEWMKMNHSQAEIHMQVLAEAMWDALNASTPKQLNPGEWHIPFNDNINDDEILQKIAKKEEVSHLKTAYDIYQYYAIKIATARCARISYETLGDNPKIDYETDIRLHDTLLKSKHFSPFEHCARAMNDEEYQTNVKGFYPDYNNTTEFDSYSLDKAGVTGWCRNYRGFIQYRHLIDN